jgi:acetyl-CoA carboxylase carboxyltransferase component
MATTDDRPEAAEDSTEAKLRRLEELRDEALHAGTEKAVAKHHAAGKLLARERAERFCDPGSFVELDRYVRHREANFGMLERRPWGDAVVTGYGTVFGRKVFLFSQDFTVFGGSLSEVFAEKICKVMDLAVKYGCRSSGSTTPAAHGSRRASSRSRATRRSSGATSRPRASSRSSRS